MTRFVRTPPLDMLALQRHMLSQMGVGFWVGKQAQICTFDPSWYTRGAGEPTSDTANVGQKDFDKVSPTQTVKPSLDKQIDPPPSHLLNDLAMPNLPTRNQLNAQTDNNLKPPVTPTPIVQAVNPQRPNIALPKFLDGLSVQMERFGLFGVRYGDWVLIADEAFLNQHTYGLWTALINALKKHNPNTLPLHIGYPLVANDYPEYQHYHQGTMVLLGFLIRLCYDVERTPLKVAFLTPISQGIHFGALQEYIKNVPSLEQIVHNPTLKHHLWQLLHS